MAATARINLEAVLGSTKNGPVSGVLAVQQAFNLALSLNASSTPDVTVSHSSVQALSGGALTLDLTSLTDQFGVAQSLSGLIVQAFIIRNLGANDMTFVAAASNGYSLFQATTPKTIYAGGVDFEYSPAGFGTVGASAKDITVAGTGTQTFELFLAAGAA